ncbi:response regulator transcription factor [Salipaludibacillus sp. HK11]|uniref:response regulator transcription factor n=1 Tax=Salipaludibacillus sp. HK11 TaxID=3394320 RepID=UPI0039FC994D
MIEEKELEANIFIIDDHDIVEEESFQEVADELEGIVVKKIKEVPQSFEKEDIFLYVVKCTDLENTEEMKELLLKLDCRVILVTEEEVPDSFISYLTLPLHGLLSLSFFLTNKKCILQSIYMNNVVLDVTLHRSLVCEIERRKMKRTPIAKFLLRKDRVKELLKENEQSVLQLLLDGVNNQDIAKKLYFSTSAVSTIVSKILRKTQAQDRTHATVLAIRNGWVDSIR